MADHGLVELRGLGCQTPPPPAAAAAEAAGANAPAEEESGDGHEEDYEEDYEEDGADGRAHRPWCSKLLDAVDHAPGLNDFMRVILEPLEEVFYGRGEITISSFTNRRIDIGIPKGRTVTMKLTQGKDRSRSSGEAGQRADGARHAAAH